MQIPVPSNAAQPPSSLDISSDPMGGHAAGFTGSPQDPTSAPFPVRRGSDRRLRGLDLGSQHLEDATSRQARRKLPRRRHRRRLLVEWVAALTVAVLAALALRASVVEPFSVPSAAMMPTLHIGDRILVVKSSRLAGPIRGGDMVVFRRPNAFPCSTGRNKASNLVERVIALPGNTIWSAGRHIFIDGAQLNERSWYWTKYGQIGSTPISRMTIPPNHYYVMGDNRSDSCDSRAFGPISRSAIVGKVVAIVVRDRHPYIHIF
ncbi:MAG: signal peptidase I [Acidimicrobiales bacterium]|jgi:signal peptidase I